MAQLSDIKYNDWSLSLDDAGEVVQGAKDIEQCISIIVNTVLGSDPMRVNFGCDLFGQIDKPINRAAADMVLSIKDGITRYEPRATLTGVKFELRGDSNIAFTVSWTDKYTNSENNYTFTA